MALDSKQKRGSAISLTMPHRSWLAEPDGTLADTDRMSLLKLCSAIAPDAPVSELVGALCGTASTAARLSGVVASAARLSGVVTITARLKGIVRNACT